MLYLLFVSGCGSDYPINTWVEEVVDTEMCRESFEAYPQKLDVAIIADESGSMGTELEMLYEQIPAFLERFNDKTFTNLDVLVGVGGADPNNAGLYGFVNMSEPTAEEDLNTLVGSLDTYCKVHGDRHCTKEAGLDSMLVSHVHDEEYRHDEADLLVVWISDEPDQSSNTAETYLAQVYAFREPPFMTYHAAIVYTNENDVCWESDGSSLPGTGYMEAANMVLSLCEPETWSDAIDLAANHLPYVNQYLNLEQKPFSAFDIKVFERNEDSMIEIKDDFWNYNATTNTVQLKYDPIVGTKTEVFYQTEGLCPL